MAVSIHARIHYRYVMCIWFVQRISDVSTPSTNFNVMWVEMKKKLNLIEEEISIIYTWHPVRNRPLAALVDFTWATPMMIVYPVVVYFPHFIFYLFFFSFPLACLTLWRCLSFYRLFVSTYYFFLYLRIFIFYSSSCYCYLNVPWWIKVKSSAHYCHLLWFWLVSQGQWIMDKYTLLNCIILYQPTFYYILWESHMSNQLYSTSVFLSSILTLSLSLLCLILFFFVPYIAKLLAMADGRLI